MNIRSLVLRDGILRIEILRSLSEYTFTVNPSATTRGNTSRANLAIKGTGECGGADWARETVVMPSRQKVTKKLYSFGARITITAIESKGYARFRHSNHNESNYFDREVNLHLLTLPPPAINS